MLSHWERVEAALRGDEVDVSPVSLWRHFPEHDQSAGDLAAVTLEWQRAFDFDFVKLMPPGDYPTIDWGAESVYRGSPGGTRETVRYPVTASEDWARLQPVPVDRGMNREVVEAARLVDEALGGQVPVLQTIFSPLTVAMKLSAGRVIDHLREWPDRVHLGLTTITQVTRAVVRASLERGAAGVFFATQCATTELLTLEEYREFGVSYDLQVLEAASGARLTLLHLHGQGIMFEELARYPVHAVNWHDRRTWPSLAEGQQLSGRCVVGGIDERAIAAMTPLEVAAQARDAVAQLSGRWLMVAPGCVIPVATPEANVRTVVDAVRAVRSGPEAPRDLPGR
jgi:uroporphyrinogen decarboxylase